MDRTYGQVISGTAADGTPLQSGVFNENEVRAAAGLTMVVGAVAFAYAYFDKDYVPLQVVATFFFVEFLIRVTLGLRYSPTGVVARFLTQRQPPDWVSAKPKRFAWTLGLSLSLAMTIITNSGVRGLLPRTICLICLTLMWMESVLGALSGLRDPRPPRPARVGDEGRGLRDLRQRRVRDSRAGGLATEYARS